MSDTLITRYRPRSFDDVIGQDHIVAALSGIIARNDMQCFLFSGESGMGKTTLARLTAEAFGCAIQEGDEIDAATHTGIDAMRRVQEITHYVPFGGSNRAIIVDECHSLSKQAWQSLLKATEEPPPHVYWFFATTDPGRVPDTMKRRAAVFTLKPVPDHVLHGFLDTVCTQEGITLADGVDQLLIRESRGSPGVLLANLVVCADAADRNSAAALLRSAQESEHTVALCRALANGCGWGEAVQIVARMEDSEAESVRIVVSRYFSAMLKKPHDQQRAKRVLVMLEAFATPYHASDGMAPLYLSLARAILAYEGS